MHTDGAPGPAIDDQARRAYQARIRELQQEIEEANDANDWVRGERSEAEPDALISQMAGAFGLSGRQRATGGATERARAAVTHRIQADDMLEPALSVDGRASIDGDRFAAFGKCLTAAEQSEMDRS